MNVSGPPLLGTEWSWTLLQIPTITALVDSVIFKNLDI